MCNYLSTKGRFYHFLIPALLSIFFIDSYYMVFTLLYIAFMAWTIIDFSNSQGVLRKAKEEGKDKLTILIYGTLLIAKWVILTYIIGLIIAIISHQSFYVGYNIFTRLFVVFEIPKLGLFPRIENFE